MNSKDKNENFLEAEKASVKVAEIVLGKGIGTKKVLALKDTNRSLLADKTKIKKNSGENFQTW